MSKLIEVFGCKADFLRDSWLSCENLTQQTGAFINKTNTITFKQRSASLFPSAISRYYLQEKSISSLVKSVLTKRE